MPPHKRAPKTTITPALAVPILALAVPIPAGVIPIPAVIPTPITVVAIPATVAIRTVVTVNVLTNPHQKCQLPHRY